MNTNLSSSAPSQLETDCLVVVVLDRSKNDRNQNDRSDKDRAERNKPAPSVECADPAVGDAAKDVMASGEVTAKAFETTLLHRPAELKAKRLLLVGGGKAKTFSAAELRQLAGTAVRTLKAKSIRSFAFALPENGIAATEGVRAIVEGAFVGNFDPGYYKSDRNDKDKDQKIDAVTIVVPKEVQSDTKPLEKIGRA